MIINIKQKLPTVCYSFDKMSMYCVAEIATEVNSYPLACLIIAIYRN